MTTEHPSQLEDYGKVRDLLAFLTENWRDQPSLETLASRVHLSTDGVQRLFTRWAGITPKTFLQAITLDHARAMLKDSASILDTALDVGLSGPGRLHDLLLLAAACGIKVDLKAAYRALRLHPDDETVARAKEDPADGGDERGPSPP